MFKEFKSFLLKQNALALAIGVIIGAAIGKVVSGIVDDLVMPVIGLILPGGDWRLAEWVLAPGAAIKYGDFLGRVIDFAVIAAVIFFLTKALLKEKPVAAAPTKQCTECLETVPLAAKRCKACGQAFTPAEAPSPNKPLKPVAA